MRQVQRGSTWGVALWRLGRNLYQLGERVSDLDQKVLLTSCPCNAPGAHGTGLLTVTA